MSKDNKIYASDTKGAQNAKKAKNLPICVLGVIDTPEGRRIANEMKLWMSPVFEIFEVDHDGTQYELPALLSAKAISEATGEPVLYLHTRGACNVHRTTGPTHRMWREEFGRQWRKYFTLAQIADPLVVAPFVDNNKTTRYNGFVANPAAWAAINIEPKADRMEFEHLWRGTVVDVLGLLINRDERDIQGIRTYLYNNFA